MIHPDYPAFAHQTQPLFSLRESGKAAVLRKALGIALDRRFAKFQKGIVQEKKSQFINLAKLVSGVSWSAKEPHKIITTLKNTGDGDEEMTRALYFLCCITDEFEELRDALAPMLGNDMDADQFAPGLPKKAFRFRELIGGHSKEIRHKVKSAIEALNTQREKMAQDKQLGEELKSQFGLILGDSPDQPAKDGERTLTSLLIESSEDKIIGRGFVENDAAKFIETHSSPACGTLSIIDIDDLTKINKVYGRNVGDDVIKIIGMLAGDSVKGLKQKNGRCGDDTFFVALAGQDEDTTKPLMDGLRESVGLYPWKEVVPGLRVTISIGIAGFRPLEPSLDMAVRAGEGMRHAKEKGGNVITLGPRHLSHSGFSSPVSTLTVWS